MLARSLLVVDSDRRNRAVLEQKLIAAGFDVLTASNADEAFDQAAKHRPDLVLSEVDLPGSGGLDLCRRLRADERTNACGIVLLSRDSSINAKQDALGAGCDDYLIKPIFVKEVVIRLGNL